MPRRPVKPQDRQRVARACESCKASKKRCDGVQPCKTCAKKGLGDSCHYTAGRRHHPLPRRESAPDRMSAARLSQASTGTYMANHDLISPESSWETHAIASDSIDTTFIETVEELEADQALESASGDSSSEPMAQPSVMLASTSGDKVFVGNTAAISFLRFLQKTLERYVGPSGFTAAQESQSLFEADATEGGSSRFYDGLSLDDRKSFAHCFFDASSGLLDLYSWDHVSLMLENHNTFIRCTGQLESPHPNSLDVASLYLMVAIGAQCCGRNTDDVALAAELFSFARKLALEKMLENPSLEMVRAFLLMSFYMLGACRRNSAFMYLGVASKAADILGLHMSMQYKHLSASARSARLRTAKSLRVFDVVCNSILGRPSTTPSLRPGYTNYLDNDSDASTETIYRALALGATYETTAILDSAVSQSAEGGLNAGAAEDLVLALQQRSRNFPAALRRQETTERSSTQYTVVGNVHVSGLYYFSVILATRQFLIQHVVPQLSTTDQSLSRLVESYRNSLDMVKVSRLADACIEAATFMAEMCHEIMRSGHLLGNMCIVKAWMFATGLVLGFSLLVENSKRYLDRRAAFLKSLHVLSYLKRLSPQAEQYYNILSNFHAAIKAYKERTNTTKNASGGALVDRVFLPDSGADQDDDWIATQLPSPDITVDSLSTDWCTDLPASVTGDTIPVDPTLFGDNDIIMRMLWETDIYTMDYPDCSLTDPQLNLQATMPILEPSASC